MALLIGLALNCNWTAKLRTILLERERERDADSSEKVSAALADSC